MDEVIAALYAHFARYSRGADFAVCDCGECLSDSLRKDLIKMPLCEISAAQMRDYLSALSWCESAENAAAVRASKPFLPRILELMAARAELSVISEEFTLSRFHFAREQWWSDAERVLVARFAQCFWQEELARETDGLVSAVNWLIAFALAEVPIAPLLTMWRDQAADDTAVWHFIEMVRGIFVDEDFCFSCNYLDDKPEIETEITRWLHARETRDAFAGGVQRMLASGCYRYGSLAYLQQAAAVLENRKL